MVLKTILNSIFGFCLFSAPAQAFETTNWRPIEVSPKVSVLVEYKAESCELGSPLYGKIISKYTGKIYSESDVKTANEIGVNILNFDFDKYPADGQLVININSLCQLKK